jgi:outer membrane protein OmpA-like peptidoglycan-associated protein
MLKKILLTLFVCLIAFSQIDAQMKLSTRSKKAIKKFESALNYYDMRNDQEAIKELKSAIKADDQFLEAYLLLADIYFTHDDYENEIIQLEKAISISPDKAKKSYLNLGLAYFLTGNYSKALPNFQKFLQTGPAQKFVPETEYYVACCEFAINAMENPVDFNPVNLGESVNTEFNDYMPSITADEEILVTTVALPIDRSRPFTLSQNIQEDFFISIKKDGHWTEAMNMGPPINTPGNEGAQTISSDGRIMLFTACHRPDRIGRSCDIYFSTRNNRGWDPPQNIGKPINSEAWESQPSISSDGRCIYFTSGRPGGYGGKDLWKSELGKDGYWQEPVNLGPKINTENDEVSPFIHPDNTTLYFSSNGHVGMGGYDIFRSQKDVNGDFSKHQNLGYPINTFKNEEYLVVNAKGNLAYFASDRPGSRRKDIYNFELYPEARPVPVAYVKGQIYDASSKDLLSAKIELVDLDGSISVAQTISGKFDGKYLVCLPTGRNYAFNVSKDGYLFHSENFSLKDLEDPTKPYLLDIGLDKIQAGKSVVLKNIFFETDSYALKPESKTELDELVSFLNKNTGIKIEIGGHTDNVGTETYNQELSENRAKSVYDYLADHGIEKDRLEFKGYGLSKPIDSNETEEGRANNRRTEFTIIE